MNKIILADSQAIFRAGTAKVLASDDDFRIIAQCSDTERMMHAVTTFPGAVVIFASADILLRGSALPKCRRRDKLADTSKMRKHPTKAQNGIVDAQAEPVSRHHHHPILWGR